MATKNVSLTLTANQQDTDITSTAYVTGKTVYGHTVTASTSVVQEAVTITPYIYIEGETTHNASGETHILDQSKTFTFNLSTVGIQESTLGTASTVNHTTEHGDINGAWAYSDQLNVNLDGRNLEHIGTGYATNYIDVTGTSIYGGTIRATLVFRIELQKVTMTFDFEPSPAPSVSATYSLYVDNNIVKTDAGATSITYVSYSEHTISVVGVVSTTSSYDPQTINITVLGSGSIIDPNNLSLTLELPGNYGPHTSTSVSTRFMVSGTVKVSFGWTQQYVYGVTTTQAGCKVVVGGVTLVESSTANHTYTISSVESSLSYSVTKSGYYPENGTITGPNRNITVTLVEIVETYETVRTEQTYATIINRTDVSSEIPYISIQLLSGTTVLSTWLYQNISVGSNNSTTTPTTGLSIGEKQILTNTTLDVEISIPYTYATGANKMTFQFPEWSAFGGSSIVAYMQGESFYGKKSLPILERAPGDVYVFPNTNFTITFEQ